MLSEPVASTIERACQRGVACLFVDARGVYAGFEGVELWGIERDARRYAGPLPVVAHPPCARWGRYAEGGPSHHGRFKRGDDGGCFAAALEAVRAWGGVLEHPVDSSAWAAHGLLAPLRSGGWSVAGDGLGWTCCVEQGHYGHCARKPSWLYAVGVELASMPWGRSAPNRPREVSQRSSSIIERLSHRQREATPLPFAQLLVSMARTVRR